MVTREKNLHTAAAAVGLNPFFCVGDTFFKKRTNYGKWVNWLQQKGAIGLSSHEHK
jgi:hypothetical protein